MSGKAFKPSFREFLAERRAAGKPVYLDGGMGTMIQRERGLKYSIPEDLNFYRPDVIRGIHVGYLKAGCHIITSNSFGANDIKLSGEKKSSRTAAEYIERAICIQKEAVAEAEACGVKGPHYMAWDTGQIGKLLEPMGPLTFDQAYESYKAACMAAEKAGADLAIIETMSDLYEMKAAVLAVKENTSLPIIATMTFQPDLRTLTGADVLTCVTYLEALRVDALGFNCGGSLEEDAMLSEQFMACAHVPVCVQPNAGLPEVEDGRDVFRVEAGEFADAQVKNFLGGAAILGGCCGTTPRHIEEMISRTDKAFRDNAGPRPAEGAAGPGAKGGHHASATFICSYNKTQQIGGSFGPVIIGERINPTGKKKCREALLGGDMDFIRSEAESQINAGAHILDVNVGLPGTDEAQTMVRAVKSIQEAFNAPLQIDSSEPAVLESALRHYNGKALVNSVNGKQEVMDRVLPLIAHYGGSVVALCIDEDGISPTAEGRVKVARRIIREAARYSIPVRDILIDTLTLTVSSEQKSALETVRAIRMLREEYGEAGLKFVLGVSNISFGLPRRDIINSRFFMLALEAGLSAAIINPGSQTMMDTYRAYRALSCFDENSLDYIKTYTGTQDPYSAKYRESILEKALTDGSLPSGAESAVKKNADGKTSESPAEKNTTVEAPVNPDEAELIQIIEKGFKDRASDATARLLAHTEPVHVIDRCIVPALDNVGKDFEAGRKFLPQLLLSAETVGNSFAKIKETLSASGAGTESKGTIVLATVHGDIHDIGKNIVRAMLENYGYTVIDLGKNVPSERIVKTVLENDIRLVGLSALMTTTVASMEQTIKDLRAALSVRNRECSIMVGGAVLSPDYARKIGADYYSKDAMESVAIARKVFS
ncbi:MAG: homocysteine S-methyltransferase family protein [Treponema sp.]|nr:homocysteine S-methyltransferase family protein [Treponema sp.]